MSAPANALSAHPAPHIGAVRAQKPAGWVRGGVGAFALVLLSSGCAERGLVTRPEHTATSATWVAVWMAAGLAALLVGVLLTLPVWRDRSGARVAVSVLTVQAGVITITGVVLAAVAARSWQLVDRPADAAPAVALLRLSRVDGDGAYLAIMVLVLGLLTLLLASLSAGTARLAASTDAAERLMAVALLAVEAGCSGYLMVRLALGAHGLPFLGGAIAFPVLAWAVVSSWPRQVPT